MTTHGIAIETWDAPEVARLLRAGRILLIDVREPIEYASERIPGGASLPALNV
jgi:rhodanese-related sulfurtransferase